MAKPVVEMDGDEMTRIIWQFIKEKVVPSQSGRPCTWLAGLSDQSQLPSPEPCFRSPGFTHHPRGQEQPYLPIRTPGGAGQPQAFLLGQRRYLCPEDRLLRKEDPQGLWESDDTASRPQTFWMNHTLLLFAVNMSSRILPPGRWVVLPSVSACSKGAGVSSSHVFLLTYWT